MFEKKYETKYGTFYDELSEEDIKFFEMTDKEFDERANRLANKTLNGIRDEEVINADVRVYRNWVLRYGKTKAELRKSEMNAIFN